MSRIPAQRSGDGVEVLGRRHEVDGTVPADGEVEVLVRPENVAVTAGGDAIVTGASFLGAVTRLTVKLADGTDLKADLPTDQAAKLPVGGGATVSLPDRPVLVDRRVTVGQ